MNKKILNYIKTLSDNEKTQELLMQTIGKILLKQDNFNIFNKNNENKIIHIRDWINSVINNNEEWKKPRVLTLEALNNAANKYFEKKINKIKIIELDEAHEKLIADLGDYYVVQMLTPEALDNESKVMQHCIGEGIYDDRLNKKEYKYLSLRDKFNKAHVTLEIYKNHIRQLQGKQNEIPEEKYLNFLVPWLLKNDFNLDLDKYEIIINENDNKIYSIYNMPDNCIINGNLNLSYLKIERLPRNLEIRGSLNLKKFSGLKILSDIKIQNNLYLENSDVEVLSDNIYVGGSLIADYSKIKKISSNINVGGSFFLNNSAIEEFPDNFTVKCDLNLRDCINIKLLPQGLIVNGSLYLSNTNIKQLPNDIKIKENLILAGSLIEELPDNLILNGNLILIDCKKIKRLPNSLIVNGSLYLSGTKIFELPNNLVVNGDLNLKGLKITELPDNIHIGKSLDLSETKIEKLPDNLFINENLNLDRCQNIKNLPKRLNVKFNLVLSNSSVLELPEDIFVGNNLVLNNSKIEKLPNNLFVNGNLNLMYCNNIKELPNGLKVKNILMLNGIKNIDMKDVSCNFLYVDNSFAEKINDSIDFKTLKIDNHLYSKKKFLNQFNKTIIF